MSLMDPFNICSWITKGQTYADAHETLHAVADLESVQFGPYDAIKPFILIHGLVITLPLMRTLLFLCIH